MQRTRLLTSTIAALMLSLGACGETADSQGEGFKVLEEGGIEAVAFISRSKRLEIGDVFQYTSFSTEYGSAQIYTLDTVSGGAEPKAITSFGEGDWPEADIMAMDVSFDGQEIVFSARLAGDSHYNLYRIKIDGRNPHEPDKTGPSLIHTGPYHSVYPVYMPDDRIFFMTNETVTEEVEQFNDEYNRGETAQAATIDLDGSDLQFGPRNLSHRVSPTLITVGEGKDKRGQILHTNWDHLTNVNEGNLMVMNPDMTGAAEFFGKEGSGVSNSYLKARQVNGNQFLAIATDREDTFQAGAVILIDKNKNEKEATAEVLTPDVPLDMEPSFEKIGRYYDAYPVTDDKGKLAYVLTSWANGPVQTEIASGESRDEVDYGEGAGPPDFGLFVLDPDTGKRLPLYNHTDMWDVMPMAIGKARDVPNVPAGAVAETPEGTSLIGALNVAESSLGNVPGDHKDIFRVRVIEGFSTEEGVPQDFGLTEADGAILLGEAPVKADGSFAAFVPEDRPIHLQILDQYGMSIVNEDRWFSSAPGEQRFCGGCHEERGATSVIEPGISDAVGEGPANFALPYATRAAEGASYDSDWNAMVAKVVEPDDDGNADADRLLGIPWDMAVQRVFDDAGCISCHEGTPGPANPTVIITDTESPDAVPTEWTFDLTGEKVEFEYGMMTGYYTKSHISTLLIAGMMNEEGVSVEYADPSQPYQQYIAIESARDSVLIKYVQPEQVYPTHDPNKVAFAGEMQWDGTTPYAAQHPNEDTAGFDAEVHRPLSPYEKYLLVMVADLGGQYYSLENAPGTEY